DPITYLPTTHLEHHCLIQWHMGWLPGCYEDCPCGTGYTSQNTPSSPTHYLIHYHPP
ncbi:hypothetical protein BJ085DRAFT_20168, partial [Dimargaris cristalligena]